MQRSSCRLDLPPKFDEFPSVLVESPFTSQPSVQVFGQVFRIVFERRSSVTKRVTIEAAGDSQRFTERDQAVSDLRQ